MLLAFAVTVPRAAAQEQRPQIMPGERKAPRKKDAGPRAVAVLRLSPNGKSSLVPIAILIDGKFWDAAAYKANPIPMALEPETVYEVERTGNSLGLFTVHSALHANGANVPVPWIATGIWRPAGAESTEKKEVKAEPVPAGLEASDAPPRLTRNPAAASGGATAGEEKKPAPAQTAPPAASKPSGNSSSGDEPPRLSKPAPPPSSAPEAGSPPNNSNPTASAPAGSSTSSSEKKDVKPASNIPASDSGAKMGNRPQLRRGKPEEAFVEEDVPGYSKPGKAAVSSSAAAKTMEAVPADTDVQTIPAISDASGPGPHSFTFDLYPNEESDRRKQMSDLAQSDLRVYADARTKATTTTPATRQTRPAAKRSTAAKPQDAVFDNVKLVAYDLWNSNTPILVFSADAHMPPAPSSAATADSGIQYSILLVAYPDIYGNLRKLYSGVTDKFHLDITPRLELVDAVDVDGDGRGELLFREISDAGAGWVIYRASADKLWKMYDSLNPE